MSKNNNKNNLITFNHIQHVCLSTLTAMECKLITARLFVGNLTLHRVAFFMTRFPSERYK